MGLRISIFLVLAGLSLQAAAFPEGATPPTADGLKAAVSGKVFALRPEQGPPWRWQFDVNGYYFLNINNFSDSGKWVAKDGTLCTEGRRVGGSCNEVRSLGLDLYLKRDSGEILKMIPQ